MARTAARAIGRRAERLAEDYLLLRGLRLVERNFLCRHGEIDLVMRQQDTLVFVEVRRRRRTRFAGAAATVTPRKQDKLVRAAGIYLGRHRQFRNLTIRFDVLAIDDHGMGTPAPDGSDIKVQWLQDAFRPVGSRY